MVPRAPLSDRSVPAASGRPEEASSAERTGLPSAPFWRWMFGLGVVLMLLRGANVAYVLHCADRDGIDYFHGPDTGSYLANAAAMFDERPMSPLFRERIAYPFLLAAVKAAGGEYRHLLWLTVPLEIPSVLAMALLGWALTRRRAVAALGAILYALNPNGFQLGTVLMADWFNGQIILMGMALLMNWAMNGHRASGWGAALLLPLSQTIRPTLFPIVVPVLLLLANGFRSKERRWTSALVCASLLVYPAINTAINYRLYGVPNQLLTPGFLLRHGSVSYVRALQRNAENPDSMTRLYFDEKHNVAMADPRERALESYGHRPIHPDFAPIYRDLHREATTFLRAHPGLWFQASLEGISRQLFFAPALRPLPKAAGLYPDLDSAMNKIHVLALFFAFCGVGLTLRKFPVGVTLFYAACTALIALASTAAWHDSVRVRLLLDLIYTPILAVGLLSVPAWGCFAAWSAVVYGPRKLFGWPHAYVQIATTAMLGLSAAFLLRRSGPVEPAPPDVPPG